MDELIKRRNLDLFVKNQSRIADILTKKEKSNEDIVLIRLLGAKKITNEKMIRRFGIQDLQSVIRTLRKNGEEIKTYKYAHWSLSRYKNKPITYYYLAEYDECWIREVQNTK